MPHDPQCRTQPIYKGKPWGACGVGGAGTDIEWNQLASPSLRTWATYVEGSGEPEGGGEPAQEMHPGKWGARVPFTKGAMGRGGTQKYKTRGGGYTRYRYAFIYKY